MHFATRVLTGKVAGTFTASAIDIYFVLCPVSWMLCNLVLVLVFNFMFKFSSSSIRSYFQFMTNPLFVYFNIICS